MTMKYVGFGLPLTPFYPAGARMFSIGGKRIRTRTTASSTCANGRYRCATTNASTGCGRC